MTKMSAHNKQELTLPTLQEFELLLEDKAFVDHFNVFLSLPVWGQQVIYSFQDKEFEFEPPIRRRRYFVHRRAVITWLRQERLPYFIQTRLYVQYALCCRLRDIGFHVQDAFGKEQAETPETTRVFTANLLSHVVGMQLFRESLRDTCGDRVFNCWQDIELFRQTTDTSVRRSQYQHIKTQYFLDGGPHHLAGKTKCLFHYGKLNFEIVPDNILELIDTLSKMSFTEGSFNPDAEEALTTLQGLLLVSLRKYWVPRHVLHVLNTTSAKLLQPLFRLGEGEDVSVDEVERLVRCRRMFPRLVVTEPEHFTSHTEVYTSNTLRDDPRRTPTPPGSPPKEPGPEDLLALWGGGGPFKQPVEEVTTMDSMSRPWSAVSWAYNDDSIITETPDSPGQIWEEFSPSPPNGDEDLRTPSGSSISNMLNRNSSIQLPDSSLSRMILSSIERKKIGSMPLLLKDYILGRRDCKASAPRVGQRILFALAADQLANWPFMQFLKNKNLLLDINYLNFWLDVRTYLRLDDTKVDRHGVSSRRLMARTLAERYLLSAEEDESIFSEGLKMALLDTLSRGDDESLLFAAHDIVSSTLNISWRKFVGIDRRKFARAACGKRLIMYINSLQSPPPRALLPPCEQTEPVYFKEARQRLHSSMDSECSSDTTSPPPTCSLVRPLGEEHRTIAFEHSIILSEQNVSLMPSMYSMADMVNCVTGSYGSLELCHGDVVRQEHLRRLVCPEKIDILGVRVSRKVILPKIIIPKQDSSRDVGPRGARLVLRRNGVMINMPNKPRSFMEVLNDPQHQEFFKRFLMARKVTVPLQFWKAVEDLKDTPSYKARNMKTNHIFRRFFGKQAKHGAGLECNDEVIRQIPFMDSITPGMMVCAQASVYRMMERKWYPGYLESFPPESEIRPVTPTASLYNMTALDDKFSYTEPLVKEWLPRRKIQKKKTFHLWHSFVSIIIEFLRSMKSRTEVELFEVYLKRELDRMEPSEKLMETREVNRGRDSIAYDGNMSTLTRVVVRNKVVVVNKLPRDLQFWLEVDRFKQQVDGITQSGIFDKADAEQLLEKARAIVSCFLMSDVPPRVQINIPNDLAAVITNSINTLGPNRGMFHDACVLIFPVLYHFWRKFSMEWLENEDPDLLLRRIRDISEDVVTDTPHGNTKVPDFTKATVKDIKTYLVPGADEDIFRINFTLMTGIRLLLPKPKGNWKPDKGDEDSTYGDRSGSGRKGLRRLSMTSVGSGHSGRNLQTALSKRLSTQLEDLSSATSGNKDSRRSSGRESSGLTPGEQTRNKARRLSALVQGLNVRRDESHSPQPRGGRRMSRAMKNIHDVIRMAQAFGPEEDEGESSSLF